MLIGIDGSRAFMKNRTGIEEYAYQTIKNLRDKLDGHQVVLYVSINYELDTNIRIANVAEDVKKNLNLPDNWKIKVIRWPRFWTQLGLSLELLLHPVDRLFVPAHTVPFIHPGGKMLKFKNIILSFFKKSHSLFSPCEKACLPAGRGGARGGFEKQKKTIVTIHGLEYEFLPDAYSLWERIYMRFFIKRSCRWSDEIISVSENTKKDLEKLYGVVREKVKVIYEGYDKKIKNQKSKSKNTIQKSKLDKTLNTRYQIPDTRYLLFIGRIERRKNVIGVIKAFEILKEKYGIKHKLILAGKPGHGYEDVSTCVSTSVSTKDIIETGYISEEEKWELLKNADVFLFPTFYEGFGIPILEAQSAGIPVVAGSNSSIPEIVNSPPLEIYPVTKFYGKGELEGDSKTLEKQTSALLVNVNNPEEIAQATWKLISNENFKKSIIQAGYENVKRFSWDKCAKEISEVLVS